MKNGGNAFDGACSAILCSSLTQLQSMGLFGGFLLTFYNRAERKSLIIDAQMTSPKKFQLPIKNVTDVKYGPKAIATPGSLKGLWEIHKQHGSISWRQLIEPTLSLCKTGITISKHLYDSMNINKRIINDPYLKELFVDRERQKFKRPGSSIILKKHCQFLEALANHTGTEIYSGAVGEMIFKDFKESGSFVTFEDLKEYKVKWSKSIEFPMSDNDILIIPNTAAVLIPSILNIVKKFNFNVSSFDDEIINKTVLTHHRIVEAFKHVIAVRSQLGDPDFIDVKRIVAHLISHEYSQKVADRIDDTKTFSEPKYYSDNKFIAPDDDGTSHISIIAANGDAISVTSSINY